MSRMSASVNVGRNDEVISVDQDAGGRGRWTEDPTAQLGEEVRPHAVGAESVNAEHGERELPSTPNRPKRRQTPTCNEVIEGPRPERDVLRNIKIIFCKDVLHRKKMLRDRKVGSGS